MRIGSRVDPITFEVVQNALGTIADEMALTIMRTAYSAVVRDAMDYSTALCDNRGNMIAQGLTIVMHLGSFPGAVEVILERFAGDINSEDVFILNDPYGSGGIHLPDIYIIKPIFCSGELHAFACALAHHTDVGGIVPGSNSTNATEIYQEGLRIPTLKLYEKGMPNQAIFSILEKNVRVPDKVLGDLRSTVAAANTGDREYQTLAARYGTAMLRDYCDELLDYSERVAREEISDLPDGRYEFTDYIDAETVEDGPVVIQVAVIIEGDHVIIDFEGTSAQVKAGINCPLVFTRSAAAGAIRLILDPAIPNSAGYFRVLEVRAPVASVANAVLPAACGARGMTGFRILDAVLGALAQVVPERVPAGGEGGNSILSMGGYDSQFNAFVFVDLLAGARGGAPWGDGVEGIPHPGSNIANTPIELIEADLPVRVERYELLADSAGPGKYRGACGHIREVRLLADAATLQIRSDKRIHPPYGLAGGLAGGPSNSTLLRGDLIENLPTLAVSTMRRGDLLQHVLAGGGGWGDPLDRDVDAVCRDILEQKVTPEAARDQYGVISDSAGQVDASATSSLRARLRP